MKNALYLLILGALMLPACGGSEDPAPADNGQDPLEQVPDADAAAAEADKIDAENAEQAMDEIEKELDGE